MITEKYCNEILQQYPEYITKDQMYRICHISKKTCLFLLESGLVPNIDSGKKTRRFKIKTVDVIQYLKDRDDYPELFKAPDGFYKGKGGDKKAPSFDEVFTPEDLIRMRQYYERLLKNNPDVMSVEQVAQFTGYNKNSVSRWCGKKELKCFYIKQRYQIPKEYLLDFLVCEQLIGGASLGAKQKSIIDRCTAGVYRHYQQGNYQGVPPTLQDFREELLKQDEPEAKEIALAIELFTDGSLNTFAKHTNVDTHSRLICYDILDLGKQLQPIGMLVVLDSILNRITQNRAKGRNTFIFIDEIYLLFQHEYSANFLFTLGSVCGNTGRTAQVLPRMWTTFCRAIRRGRCLPTASLSLCSIRRPPTGLSLPSS